MEFSIGEILLPTLNQQYYLTLYYVKALKEFCTFVIPNETMGKNIEIVPCAIREQRIARHYNILKTA